ncbi:MAG: alpha/beta fold hydrolase [Sneathiellales bacterium]|nr:alpha/beta fold hydrolase [Sneathiellales bacterium]
MQTLGGRQVWGDVYAISDWRLQHNILTDHYRLLDTKDRVHCSGSYKVCKSAIDEIADQQMLAWQSEHLVVLVHGLARTKGSFRILKQELKEEGYAVLSVSYPSTKGSAEDHAKRLQGLLTGLKGISRVSFVTHSYGGLVVRSLLSNHPQFPKHLAINAAVLLAPPNQGSVLAEKLQHFFLYQLIGGQGGQSVTPRAAQNLQAVSIPIGVIAGGTGNKIGFNPVLPGDDDGIVRVAETYLKEAKDHKVIKASHTFIMNNQQVIEETKRFLVSHHFKKISD